MPVTIATETSMVVEKSSSPAAWNTISRQDLEYWNTRLLLTSASLRQYPYWNEPYRPYLHPTYLVCSEGENQTAYVCILTFSVFGLRVGVICRGPVNLTGKRVRNTDLEALREWAGRNRYAFLRFTHSDQELLDQIACIGPSQKTDPFPIFADAAAGHEEFIVDRQPSQGHMLASFDREARRKIRRALEAGYEIRCDDTPERLNELWGIIVRCSKRKGFAIHRSLSAYMRMVSLARCHNCSLIYSAWLSGSPVQVNVTFRDRDTAFCQLAALDLDTLGSHPSPSVLVHWHAMRDLFRQGVLHYNLGCAKGGVEQFKMQFNPRRLHYPGPLTLITNPALYATWNAIMPLINLAGRFGRVLGRSAVWLVSAP